jgi:hypothetical protein
MKKPSIFTLCMAWIAIALFIPSTARADAQAEKVLQGVRLASTLQHNDLNGNLRKKGKRIPIGLFLRGENIQFQYKHDNKWTVFHMRLKKNNFDLFEIIKGKNVKLPPGKLGEAIMNTDLTYEDLAFRFLYWPHSKIVGEETIKMQKCYKIRLVNPGKGGRYNIVYVWVHQKYNALMQVAGYDKDGRILKRFHVTELMKVPNGQTLKKMNVESYDPAAGKVTGITYLEFNKPKPVSKGLR